MTLSLFSTARFVLGLMPMAVKNVSEALVSLKRIQAFIELPEVSFHSWNGINTLNDMLYMYTTVAFFAACADKYR